MEKGREHGAVGQFFRLVLIKFGVKILHDSKLTVFRKMPSSKSDKKFLKELKKKEMKRKKLKDKKRSRHRTKSDTSSESSSDDSDMDLQKEMYPISHYMNDREEMINQVWYPFCCLNKYM